MFRAHTMLTVCCLEGSDRAVGMLQLMLAWKQAEIWAVVKEVCSGGNGL